MNRHHLSPEPHRASIARLVADYLGTSGRDGSIDLTRAFGRSDRGWMTRAAAAFSTVRDEGSRVFVVGNGGSYDNARLIAHILSSAGVRASTPGSDEFLRTVAAEAGFGAMFARALAAERIGSKDLLIAISGSGNSPNILEAIEAAGSAGAGLLALGGRDGGAMRKRVGDESTFIAATACMEALEDIHPLVIAAVARLLDPAPRGAMNAAAPDAAGDALSEIDASVLAVLRRPSAESTVSDLAFAVESTLWNDGRIFILGDPAVHPSVTHMDADWGRGMINQIPVRGPERMSYTNTNAWMACANDDGSDYWLVDEFAKVTVRPEDVVIVVGTGDDRAVRLCLDLVDEGRIGAFRIGSDLGEEGDSRWIPVDDRSLDLLVTTVTHIVSRTVHDHLAAAPPSGIGFRVSPADRFSWPEDAREFVASRLAAGGARKLDRRDTLALEAMLRRTGALPAGNVITWCYGEPFVVDDPAQHGLERSFY